MFFSTDEGRWTGFQISTQLRDVAASLGLKPTAADPTPDLYPSSFTLAEKTQNSYFYQTENGARVGDRYMTLLYTAQENGLNVYAYLKDLLEHFKEVAADPKPWLPWNWTGKEA